MGFELMKATNRSKPALQGLLEGDSSISRANYEAPSISLSSLSAVIAGPGGSQADDDFSVSKPPGFNGRPARRG